MTVMQLIERLKEYPPDRKIFIDNGFTESMAHGLGTIYTGYLSDDTKHFIDDYIIQPGIYKKPVVILSL